MGIKNMLSKLKPSELYAIILIWSSLSSIGILSILSNFFILVKDNFFVILILLSFILCFSLLYVIAKSTIKIINNYRKKIKLTLKIEKKKIQNKFNIGKWNVIPFRTEAQFLHPAILESYVYVIKLSCSNFNSIPIEKLNISISTADMLVKKYNNVIENEVKKIFNKQLEKSMLSELQGFTKQRWPTSQYFNDFVAENKEYEEIYDLMDESSYYRMDDKDERILNLKYIEYLKNKYIKERDIEFQNRHENIQDILINCKLFDGKEVLVEEEIEFLAELFNQNGFLKIFINIDGREIVEEVKIKKILKEKVLSI